MWCYASSDWSIEGSIIWCQSQCSWCYHDVCIFLLIHFVSSYIFIFYHPNICWLELLLSNISMIASHIIMKTIYFCLFKKTVYFRLFKKAFHFRLFKKAFHFCLFMKEVYYFLFKKAVYLFLFKKVVYFLLFNKAVYFFFYLR